MMDEKIAGPDMADAQNTLSNWVVGVLVGLVGLVGLFMASRATDTVFYWVGLLFFLFGVLFCFGLIGQIGGRSG